MQSRSKTILFVVFCLFIININAKINKSVSKTVTTLASTTKVIELDTIPENYNCINLKRNSGELLKYCTGNKSIQVKPGVAAVHGMYIRSEDAIYINKDEDNDIILHELYHANSVFKNGDRDEESKAYDFQMLYLQLIDKQIIK